MGAVGELVNQAWRLVSWSTKLGGWGTGQPSLAVGELIEQGGWYGELSCIVRGTGRTI